MKNPASLILYTLLLLFSIFFFLSANIYFYLTARVALILSGFALIIEAARRRLGKNTYLALIVFGLAAWLAASMFPLALVWARFAGPVSLATGIIGFLIALLPPQPASVPQPRINHHTIRPLNDQSKTSEQVFPQQEWSDADWAMPEEHLSSSVELQLERERDQEFQDKREEKEQERNDHYDSDDSDDP